MVQKTDKPRIRPLDYQPVIHEGQQMWLVRDPLELVDYQLILSPILAQLLTMFDGEQNTRQINDQFHTLYGVAIDPEQMDDLLDQLDRAYLLDNPRSAEVRDAVLADYRALPFRPPSLAGKGYPDSAHELSEALTAFSEDDLLDGWPGWTGRGVVSPHIDYFRGGRVYSQVWRRAESAVRQADLVLIFGTDHNGSPGSVTLTRLPYATPYGALPGDPELVETLAKALEQDVFAEELHHKNEHSVELSAVWLHHIRGADAPPVVPILCGSFHHFIANGQHPANDPDLTALLETLRRETAGKKVLAVASVDLAHVGPAFGDDFNMDADRREAIAISDKSLMEAIGQGDADRFYREIASISDRNRICGFSSIYLMLRFLGSTSGTEIAYEQCPADAQDTSLVSICGLLLD